MIKNSMLPNWTHGFLARVLASFLVISVPFVVILSILLSQQATQGLTAATQKSVRSLALGASLRLDTWLAGRQSDMQWVAESVQGHLDRSGAQILQHIEPSLDNEFDAVVVVDPAGRRLVGIGASDFQPGVEAWFPRSLQQPLVAPIVVRGSAIQWSVTAPVLADTMSPAAVVVGNLKASRLSEVMSGFAVGGATEVHLVNADHKVIYSSEWGTITDNTTLISKGTLRLSESNSAVDKALAGQSGALRTSDYRGDDVIAGFAPIQVEGWAVIASELSSGALQPVTNQVLISVLLAVIAIGVAAVAAAFVARSLARPVTELSGAAAKVVEGDLSARVAPAGAREVRQLGQRFNAMIEQLERLVTGLRELSTKASQSATRLSTAADELAAATTEQTAAATETSASMEELARTSTSIAETLQRVSVQAQETRENLEQAQTDMQASGTRTLALAERVNDVNEILSIINEIADQTNLLALNAAIEAARAGETGRGFAVVADEVRRLAERSKSSAGKISKIIEGARSESNATVMAMEQSTKQMQRGLKLLEDVVEASSHVQVITQQQRSATEQVLEAMEQIAAGSRQVSNTAQEISQAASGHAGLAAEMETMSRNGTGRA